MELDFVESILETNNENIKENMEIVNFILDNALLNLENRQKYLLYFLANNSDISFYIPKNKETLEINFYTTMFNREEVALIKSEDLEILLDMLDKNIELALCNFLNLANLNLLSRALENNNEKDTD